ncbi:MAG TPA: helix-turn-helix domain-containing protein, partial [Chloroflexota bacterium]|nr:helix-turn-helix domain-containing protein [Chloroflexota bacterium]
MIATQLDLLAPPHLTRHQTLVLVALRGGQGLSQLQAYGLGIGRLAARIRELRMLHIPIETTWHTSEQGSRYAVY